MLMSRTRNLRLAAAWTARRSGASPSRYRKCNGSVTSYLRTERGLAPRSIVRHLPIIRRFLHEVCPAGDDDLGKISQKEVIRYIERHAQDWSPRTGTAMCWSLRA